MKLLDESYEAISDEVVCTTKISNDRLTRTVIEGLAHTGNGGESLVGVVFN